MLETVLQIGKAFRNSDKNLKYHRYIKKCPEDTDKLKILRLSIPVKEDFSFDLNSISEIKDENVIKNDLYYLTFKTSDADGLVKYIFGDIFYSITKGKEGGYYRLANLDNKQKAYQVSSFNRGNNDFESIKSLFLEKNKSTISDFEQEWQSFVLQRFREEFKKKFHIIERILKYQNGIVEYFISKEKYGQMPLLKILNDEDILIKLSAENVFSQIKQSRTSKKNFKKLVGSEEPIWEEIDSSSEYKLKLADYSTNSLFLHFNFNNKNWYDFENAIEIINQKILEDFVEESPQNNGFVLKKYLYKTLSSPEKDYQFPNFIPTGRYRNHLFNNKSEILDLLYAIDYSKKALLKIPSSDIKVIVLPQGQRLKAKHYEDFINRPKSLDKIEESERIVKEQNIPDSDDLLFKPVVENIAEEITQYDLIFSKQGGLSSPDVDLVEISGIEKSKLQLINQRIREIKLYFYQKSKNFLTKELVPLDVVMSFLKILGDPTKGKKKYQNHLYKILPQIYSGIYYNDSILLPVFIEKIEFNIRNGKTNFNFLKYDFYFLTTIQNTQTEGENMMKITQSKSYKIGTLLGKLAQSLKFEIKSFEKNYVGNLSRRITTLPDLIKFKTFIEEKIVIHEKNFENIRTTSLELANDIKEFSGRYDKNECAFGFFESYFAPFKKKTNSEDKKEN